MTDNTLYDELIGALVGLARASDSNPNVTDDTYALFGGSLALPEGSAPERLRAQIDAVRAEKRRISPDCAVCMNPCGRTADYDLSRMGENGEEVLALKNRLLAEARRIAAELQAARLRGEARPADERFLCEIMFRVGYDETADTLRNFMKNIQSPAP